MIIYITLTTRYTLMFFCLFVCLVYITLPALYTLMFLCPIIHPGVIHRNLHYILLKMYDSLTIVFKRTKQKALTKFLMHKIVTCTAIHW